MIQDIFPQKMDNQYKNIEAMPQDYVMIFKGHSRRDDMALIRYDEEGVIFPKVEELPECHLIYLFAIDKKKFFLCSDYEDINKGKFEDALRGYSYEKIFAFRKYQPKDMCFAGFTGYHLFVWYRDTQRCGRCGEKLIHDKKERMMRCPECGTMFFPKIAPAVIIGLRHGDSLLMSRYAGREYKGRALLAGFCEIGETPEETVIREVKEEVGLACKNVTYYGSQPWGCDLNLLLGYFCDVDGEIAIHLDKNELATAAFVRREEIGSFDDAELISLTATMMDAFRKGEF